MAESHPAWVCGLKQKWSYNNNLIGWSHPAWVCGLKPLKREDIMLLFVTPCVGVWIETYWEMISDLENGVTPCVGVWIETLLE